MTSSRNRVAFWVAATLFATTMVGCSNPLVVTPVPDDLRGKMTFPTVNVIAKDSIPGSVGTRAKAAVQKELAKRSAKGQAMTLQITIDQWKGLDNATGGRTGAKLLGAKVEIKATVKVLDPKSQKVVAEYGVIADYQEGGLLTRTISFQKPEAILLEKFAVFVMLELY